MGNTANTESTPITQSGNSYSNKPTSTQTLLMEAQHININRDTGIPCPICKKINCRRR